MAAATTGSSTGGWAGAGTTSGPRSGTDEQPGGITAAAAAAASAARQADWTPAVGESRGLLSGWQMAGVRLLRQISQVVGRGIGEVSCDLPSTRGSHLPNKVRALHGLLG